MNFAPIALFVYNRPEHTSRVLEALAQNEEAKESLLYVFCDGPKNDKAKANVEKTRSIIQSTTGFKEVIIKESETNKGLSNSIVDGINNVLSKHETIIVLEDDILVSQYFLRYMNDGLQRYKSNSVVASIHGYLYPIKESMPETFFLKGADCWGWATWKRAWAFFNPNGQDLLTKIKTTNEEDSFDFYRTSPYTKMLKDQVAGKNDSWAIRWYASAFTANMITLYPGKSLVKNIGLDNTGTHCEPSSMLDSQLYNIKITQFPNQIEEDLESKKRIAAFFDAHSKKTNRLKKLFKGLSKLKPKKKKLAWHGNYKTWEDAVADCATFNYHDALEKVKSSVLRVKSGQFPYERDSVLFDKIEYSWPLLTGLMWIAAQNKNKLSVLDFGGSLGSTYYQNRDFLSTLDELAWSIVEQENFVKEGQEHFANKHLHFFFNIEECIHQSNPHVLLLSSVLQYLEKPFNHIHELVSKSFPYIIIDRTSIIHEKEDILTVQEVPKEIYEASIPCWFFSEEKLLNAFLDKYELIADFPAFTQNNFKLEHGVQSYEKGYILKFKNNC